MYVTKHFENAAFKTIKLTKIFQNLQLTYYIYYTLTLYFIPINHYQYRHDRNESIGCIKLQTTNSPTSGLRQIPITSLHRNPSHTWTHVPNGRTRSPDYLFLEAGRWIQWRTSGSQFSNSHITGNDKRIVVCLHTRDVRCDVHKVNVYIEKYARKGILERSWALTGISINFFDETGCVVALGGRLTSFLETEEKIHQIFCYYCIVYCCIWAPFEDAKRMIKAVSSLALAPSVCVFINASFAYATM